MNQIKLAKLFELAVVRLETNISLCHLPVAFIRSVSMANIDVNNAIKNKARGAAGSTSSSLSRTNMAASTLNLAGKIHFVLRQFRI